MPDQYYESKEDKSGRLQELFLFGDITRGRNELRYQEALKTIMPKYQKNKTSSYLPFQGAAELVRMAQEGDARNPKKRFMKDLRNAVAKKLQLSLTSAQSLTIYSAIGTPLDIYHGVDAFVELKDEKELTRRVTMDATINAEKIKEERTKSDVLIGEVPDSIEHEKEYLAFVDCVADQIVTRLKQ